jgi:hypothetical protein
VVLLHRWGFVAGIICPIFFLFLFLFWGEGFRLFLVLLRVVSGGWRSGLVEVSAPVI